MVLRGRKSLVYKGDVVLFHFVVSVDVFCVVARLATTKKHQRTKSVIVDVLVVDMVVVCDDIKSFRHHDTDHDAEVGVGHHCCAGCVEAGRVIIVVASMA